MIEWWINQFLRLSLDNGEWSALSTCIQLVHHLSLPFPFMLQYPDTSHKIHKECFILYAIRVTKLPNMDTMLQTIFDGLLAIDLGMGTAELSDEDPFHQTPLTCLLRKEKTDPHDDELMHNCVVRLFEYDSKVIGPEELAYTLTLQNVFGRSALEEALLHDWYDAFGLIIGARHPWDDADLTKLKRLIIPRAVSQPETFFKYYAFLNYYINNKPRFVADQDALERSKDESQTKQAELQMFTDMVELNDGPSLRIVVDKYI